jgi:hypothetical protein
MDSRGGEEGGEHRWWQSARAVVVGAAAASSSELMLAMTAIPYIKLGLEFWKRGCDSSDREGHRERAVR